MENKEIYKKLANQIYELDEKVYKASGSNLGKTFTGEKVRTIENLTMLITSNPQGHLLRSEMALIGNMVMICLSNIIPFLKRLPICRRVLDPSILWMKILRI